MQNTESLTTQRTFDLYFQRAPQAGPSGSVQTHEVANAAPWSVSYSTCNSRAGLSKNKKDLWIPSAVVPRVIGAAAFIVGVLGIAAQFAIALSCISYSGCKDHGFGVPYNFSIGDTSRAEPCHGTGLGFTIITSLLLVWLGWCRRVRVTFLCCGPLKTVATQTMLSDVLGVIFVALIICAAALRPGDPTALETLLRVVCFFTSLTSLLGYGYVQVYHVEGFLLSQNLIKESKNEARKKLIAISLVCIGASLALLITRDVLGPSTHDNYAFYVTVGVPLLIFQLGSVMATLAIFGLTDFSSLIYNAQRLADLGKEGKQGNEGKEGKEPHQEINLMMGLGKNRGTEKFSEQIV